MKPKNCESGFVSRRGTKILNLAPRTVYRTVNSLSSIALLLKPSLSDLFGGEPSAQNPGRGAERAIASVKETRADPRGLATRIRLLLNRAHVTASGTSKDV